MEAVKIKQFLSGNGNGNGYGNGYGNGDGYGDGNGYGDGIRLQSYGDLPIHYIDGIPCVINSIRNDSALVDVVNTASFQKTKMYVAKKYGLFAHGSTLKDAIADVEQKWVKSQSTEERIQQFKEKFKKGVKYKASLFYEWHSLLTGSCRAGKDQWVSERGINLNSDMTVVQFIELTKNAYGGDIIRRLTD